MLVNLNYYDHKCFNGSVVFKLTPLIISTFSFKSIATTNSQSPLPIAKATNHVNRVANEPSAIKLFSFIQQYEHMIGPFVEDSTKWDFCFGNP